MANRWVNHTTVRLCRRPGRRDLDGGYVGNVGWENKDDEGQDRATRRLGGYRTSLSRTTVRSPLTTVAWPPRIVPRRPTPPNPPQLAQKPMDSTAPMTPTTISTMPVVWTLNPRPCAETAKRMMAPTAIMNMLVTIPIDADRLFRCRRPSWTADRSVHRSGNTSKSLLVMCYLGWLMGNWSFLTNHARALLVIAHDPDARLRDLAAALDVTERTAYGIVVDLTEAGYVAKEKDGRRNRYHIQAHLPLRDSISRERTIGEVLDLLVDTNQRRVSRSHRP